MLSDKNIRAHSAQVVYIRLTTLRFVSQFLSNYDVSFKEKYFYW